MVAQSIEDQSSEEPLHNHNCSLRRAQSGSVWVVPEMLNHLLHVLLALQNGGSAAGAAAAGAVNTPASAVRGADGSPEAPDLELELDDELTGKQCWCTSLLRPSSLCC